jgi:hypothetical protein
MPSVVEEFRQPVSEKINDNGASDEEKTLSDEQKREAVEEEAADPDA